MYAVTNPENGLEKWETSRMQHRRMERRSIWNLFFRSNLDGSYFRTASSPFPSFVAHHPLLYREKTNSKTPPNTASSIPLTLSKSYEVVSQSDELENEKQTDGATTSGGIWWWTASSSLPTENAREKRKSVWKTTKKSIITSQKKKKEKENPGNKI